MNEALRIYTFTDILLDHGNQIVINISEKLPLKYLEIIGDGDLKQIDFDVLFGTLQWGSVTFTNCKINITENRLRCDVLTLKNSFFIGENEIGLIINRMGL